MPPKLPIICTSNVSWKVKYKAGTTDVTRDQQSGVCRTMVLTWIREAQRGVRMNSMGGILAGDAFALIEFQQRAWKIQGRYARGNAKDEEFVERDVLERFSLKRLGDPLYFQTILIGNTLDPAGMSNDDEAYTMLTLCALQGDLASAHALGLAFHIGGFHYFLDPNRGLFEYKTLDEMLGLQGHVTRYIVTNYANYPYAALEQYKLIG
jgi:hypothetical protein